MGEFTPLKSGSRTVMNGHEAVTCCPTELTFNNRLNVPEQFSGLVRDVSLGFRDVSLGFRDVSLGFRDVSLVYTLRTLRLTSKLFSSRPTLFTLS